MVLGLPKKPNMAMKLGNSILLVVVDVLAAATLCACTMMKEEDRKTTIHQQTNSDKPRCEQRNIGSRVFRVQSLLCALARSFRVGTNGIERLRPLVLLLFLWSIIFGRFARSIQRGRYMKVRSNDQSTRTIPCMAGEPEASIRPMRVALSSRRTRGLDRFAKTRQKTKSSRPQQQTDCTINTCPQRQQ